MANRTKAYQALRDASREAVGRYHDKLSKRGARSRVGFISFELLIRMRDALAELEPGVVPINCHNGKSLKEASE